MGKHRGRTYALQIAEYTQPIKIGWSKNYNQRILSLSTAIPFETKLIGTIPDSKGIKEKQIHQLFANDRIRGEWFLPSKNLIEYIDKRFEKDGSELNNIAMTYTKAPICPDSKQVIFNPEHLAYILGTTTKQIFEFCQMGAIDYSLMDHGIFFRQSEVKDFINRNHNKKHFTSIMETGFGYITYE